MSLKIINTDGSGGLSIRNTGGVGSLNIIQSQTVSLVTDGLTLQLDVSNPSSYDGSGVIWTDISGTEQNIELVNSPTFTSGTPAYFTFNGSDQFGVGNGEVLSSTSYTKSVWFYLNGYADNNLLSSDTGGHFMFMASSNKIYCGHSNWGNYLAYP